MGIVTISFQNGGQVNWSRSDGPEQSAWQARCSHHSVLHGTLPNKSQWNSPARSFQKVGITKASPLEGFFWLHGPIHEMAFNYLVMAE